MKNKVQIEHKEKIISIVFLKAKSTSIFSDINILSSLTNPKYPIAFENDFLLLKMVLWIGPVGVQGTFSLILPPVDFDIDDLWDFNRLAGKWDVWSFLSFQYQYDLNLSPTILINYNRGNFFENDLALYKMIKVKDLYENENEFDTADDLLSDNLRNFEFPEDVPNDFDYEGYYATAVTENFIDMLSRVWDFELIDNPIVQ
jgi:hypothetical protein